MGINNLGFFKEKMVFNRNDIILLGVVFLSIFLLVSGWHDMHASFNGNNLNPITLDYHALPYYTLRTTMRLLVGMVYSLLFAVVFAVLAASYAPMRRIILPFVNFMESVPLVGFLTFTTVYFLGLFPHNVMGLEAVAIFAVFTGQAWNMMLTLYQTLRIVPSELNEATHIFRYNSWQRFWRLGFVYSIPGLLWNMMVSQSAAWFAIIASEAIPVTAKDTVNLPGVGAYIATAIAQGNSHAIVYGVIAIIFDIIILDQLVFRPLVCYAQRFKYEEVPSQKLANSWFYNCIRLSGIARLSEQLLTRFSHFWLFVLPQAWYILRLQILFSWLGRLNWLWSSLWYAIIGSLCVYFGYELWEYFPKQYFAEMPHWMGLTALRVTISMLISVILFTPIGVWIGLNPNLVRVLQPIIQIMAAIPANIFYPLIALVIIMFHQNLGVWSIPIIMLGTQWYVLFNVIAGVSTLPTHMLEVTKIFHTQGYQWWTKFMLPAIFPYIVTGIISAAGGAWNTAIAAELLTWGNRTISTTGLGSFIANATDHGLNPEAALGCTMMCLMVALCIVFVWQPLYRYAENKFKID